jgi:hypothetical protein
VESTVADLTGETWVFKARAVSAEMLSEALTKMETPYRIQSGRDAAFSRMIYGTTLPARADPRIDAPRKPPSVSAGRRSLYGVLCFANTKTGLKRTGYHAGATKRTRRHARRLFAHFALRPTNVQMIFACPPETGGGPPRKPDKKGGRRKHYGYRKTVVLGLTAGRGSGKPQYALL